MKNLKLLGCLAMLFSGLLLMQCTSDEPIYVAGQNGVDGVDGVDGSAAACIACHSDSHRMPIHDAFNLSKHANETVMYTGDLLSAYGNRTACAECHTSDGFKDKQDGYPIAEGTGGSDPSYPGTQTINCTTCHSNHSTFDFENDGQDYALRNSGPHPLIVDDTYTIDFGDSSNNCVSCHQPRTATPSDDGNGTYTITSSHWGPHHGPQATMLEGLQGALLPGTAGYPGVGTATHRTGASCVSCHMGEPADETNGSHTFVPTENACITCHTSGAPAEVNGLAADLATLEGLLANVVSQDGTVTGIVVDGHPNTGTFTIVEAQAAWNYILIMEDKSNGIHNPEYAKALISNSIEALQN